MASARPRSFQRVVVATLIALAAVLAWGAQRRAHVSNKAELAQAADAVVLGVQAPQVTLFDREGTGVPLDSYRGRVVLVNFWATWCGPCLAEMPSLIALRQATDPSDLAFVAIAEDDSWPPLDAWLRKNPLPFDVYRDQPPRVEGDFETTSYPTSFLIDRDGRALYRFNGARDWDTPAVRALLEAEGVRVGP
jgi:thiol-disulfide isomerase/thioredoxin